MTSYDGEARTWASHAPEVPQEWFTHFSTLHGVRHTQRVHIHAQRLTGELRWEDADVALVLCAALWHDIGRSDDSEDPWHGRHSAARVLALGLADELGQAEADLVLFAIVHHCLADTDAVGAAEWWEPARLRAAGRHAQTAVDRLPEGASLGVSDEPPSAEHGDRLADPQRALRILWLLKDADALDRVRLQPWEAADPRMLRHPEAVALLRFADELYRVTGH